MKQFGQYERLLKKQVEKHIELNDSSRWVHGGQGHMDIVDGEVVMVSPTEVFDKIPHNEGRPSADCRITYRVDGKDANEYNRIFCEIYPDMPGFYTTCVLLIVENDGKKKLPNENWREGIHCAQLTPMQWNTVVLETAHLELDHLTGITIMYRLQGSEPLATRTAKFRIRNLRLDKVEPEYTEGWDVKPGGIAYCHSGYLPWAKKTALVNGYEDEPFRVLSETGAAVCTGHVKYGSMDFSEVTAPGTYILVVGDLKTYPFIIGKDALQSSIDKTLTFFYSERCGTQVEGIHDVCHSDWQCEHDGKRIIINGGWHDAGDLSQSCINTSEAALAMLEMAEVSDWAEDKERLYKEAQWGIDWVLRTSFHDGYRSKWAVMDFWTDGIIGNGDDVVFKAVNDPDANITAAYALGQASATEVYAPEYRCKCLAAAKEDYRFAMEKVNDQSPTVMLAKAICAAASLYRQTGDDRYYQDMTTLGTLFADRQGMESRGGFTGYFYRDLSRTGVVCYSHNTSEQYLAEALAVLYRTTKEERYLDAALNYAHYLEKGCAMGNPYGTAPNNIYSEAEIELIKNEEQKKYHSEQLREGKPLGDGFYLKNFPIWHTFCGNTPVLLGKGHSLTTLAELTGDKKYIDLAVPHLEWNLGRNPFCQSLMYGEGYDYPRYYSAMCGDLIGALPVGIQTREPYDVPYWSTACCFNYKEVWVHPSILYLKVVAGIKRFEKAYIN